MKKVLAYAAVCYAYGAFDLVKGIREADEIDFERLNETFSQPTGILALTVALLPLFYPVEVARKVVKAINK